MRYRRDGRSGNELSVLGFGCLRFPRGVNTRVDVDKTRRLIEQAVEQGINYFDTAYIYGGSEAALGEALRRAGARERVFVATKLPYQQCKRYEDFDRIFAAQLERLQTDHIDYYLIHALPGAAAWDGLCALGIEKWLAEKKAGGRIGQIGFSFHGPQGEFLRLLDVYDWAFCQIQYNYMNEHYQAGRLGLQRAHEKGLPVIIMEPMLGGRLAGGLPKRAVRLLREAEPALSPADWALRWLWDQPEVTVTLSGMVSAEQVRDNVRAAGDAGAGILTERDAALLAQVRELIAKTYRIPCTGCNYCMPCPQGVSIPECFAAYNASYAMGLVTGMTQYMTSTGAMHPGKNHGGRSCVRCGKCERHCPQNIGIMKALETVSRRMEPYAVRKAAGLVMRLLQRD